MGSRIRLLEPNIVYNTVSRTVDGTFLFAPNHRKDNRLLRYDCPPNALSPENPIIPKPSIINIIGSSIGRALEQHPINIHAVKGNINHNHSSYSADKSRLDNIPKFFKTSKSLIARNVNTTWERQGPVFMGRYRCEPCLDDNSAEQKLLYTLTNPVKDGLIAKTKDSPFFSTYKHLTAGDPLRFWYIDWAAYWYAGGKSNKKHHPKEYLKWTEWELTPLPGHLELTKHQRQTRIRKLVKEDEEKHREQIKFEKRTVIGVPALFATDPRDRPKNPKFNGPQPLCHAEHRETRDAYIAKWRDFVIEHRKASWDFRNGHWEREFPQGSFRPPVIRIITEEES